MSRLSEGLVEAGRIAKFTAAGTFRLDDSYHGKVIVLGKSSGGQHFVLPKPQAGFELEFVCGVDLATSNSTVTTYGTTQNVIAGSITSPGATSGDYTGGTEVDVITFVAGVADIGDKVRLICDGTNWYVSGDMGVSTAVTLA